MCLDQMLQPWKHAESNNQFQNSSELIPILVYFMTPCSLCNGWACIPKVNIRITMYLVLPTYTSFQSLGVSPNIKLTNHEMMVASNLVEPSSIQVSWDDIGSDFVFKIFFQSSQIFSQERN